MSETTSHNLSGVPETSHAALYWKAMESQRPDALIKDQKPRRWSRSWIMISTGSGISRCPSYST